MDLSIFKEYGLLGLIMGSVIALLFFVIKWTLSTTKDILRQAAEERKEWHEKMGKIDTSMTKICDCLDKHDENAERRGGYVKDEHEKMIKSLGEINSSLVRLNGYKHE